MVVSLIKNELRKLVFQPQLIITPIVIVIISILSYGFLPKLIEFYGQYASYADEGTSMMLVFVVTLLVSLIALSLASFTTSLMLEEQDSDVWLGLQVTSFNINLYFLIKVVSGFILTAGVVFIVLSGFDVTNFVDTNKLSLVQLVISSLLLALICPATMLLVNGLTKTYSRGQNLIVLGTLLSALTTFSVFISGKGELLFALIPTYYPVKYIQASLALNNTYFSANQYFGFGLLYLIILMAIGYGLLTLRMASLRKRG